MELIERNELIKATCKKPEGGLDFALINKIKKVPLVEALTTDEVVAMLEKLDLEIDQSAAYNLQVAKIQRLIRDKIKSLKGDNNERDL